MAEQLTSLKAEIDVKRRFIATLPDWNFATKDQVYEKAKHVKQLAENEEEYEVLVEAKRIQSVVRKHEEMHPPATKCCTICLDYIKIKSHGSMSFFLCPCANALICDNCCFAVSERMLKKCPLCRADAPTNDEERKMTLIV